MGNRGGILQLVWRSSGHRLRELSTIFAKTKGSIDGDPRFVCRNNGNHQEILHLFAETLGNKLRNLSCFGEQWETFEGSHLLSVVLFVEAMGNA